MNKQILEEGFMNIIFNYSVFFWLKYELEKRKTFLRFIIFSLFGLIDHVLTFNHGAIFLKSVVEIIMEHISMYLV